MVEGAASYRISYGETGGAALTPAVNHEDVDTTTRTISDLDSSKTYWFEIAAVGSDGAEGTKSLKIEDVEPSATASS